MTRDNRISIYVNDQTEKELKRSADREEMAVSAYINKLIQRQLRQERENEVSSQSRAVENLQKQIDKGTRQLREVADDVEDKNRKAGAYGIAAFELLKREYSEKVVDQALKTGTKRLDDDEIVSEQSNENETETETDGGDAGLDIEALREDDDYDPRDPLADRGDE